MNIFKTVYKKYLQKKYGLKTDIDKVYEDIYAKAVSTAKKLYPKYKRSKDIINAVFWNDDVSLCSICEETAEYVRDEYPKMHKCFMKHDGYIAYYSLITKLCRKYGSKA